MPPEPLGKGREEPVTVLLEFYESVAETMLAIGTSPLLTPAGNPEGPESSCVAGIYTLACRRLKYAFSLLRAILGGECVSCLH